MSDIINKPDHYTKGRQYEPLDVMQDWGLIENHYLACAFKYIARFDRKDDAVVDLKKAVFYLEREITRRSNQKVVSLTRKMK